MAYQTTYKAHTKRNILQADGEIKPRYSRYESGVITGNYRNLNAVIADTTGFDGLGFDASVGSDDDNWYLLNSFDENGAYIDSFAIGGALDAAHALQVARSQFDSLTSDDSYSFVLVSSEASQFDSADCDNGWSIDAISKLLDNPSQNKNYLPIITASELEAERRRVTFDEVQWDSIESLALASHGGSDSTLYLDMVRADSRHELINALDLTAELQDLGAEEESFDALMETKNRLPLLKDRLFAAMSRASNDSLSVVNVTQTKPFKRQGVSNIAFVFDLSDGQSVSIWFHNPDSTPLKLAPSDIMISWKWMLNKRDVTAVLSPKNGDNVQLPVLANRIMRVAAKNSKRFKSAQARKLQMDQDISDAEQRISDKTKTISDLDSTIDDLNKKIDAAMKAPKIEKTVETVAVEENAPASTQDTPISPQEITNKTIDDTEGYIDTLAFELSLSEKDTKFNPKNSVYLERFLEFLDDDYAKDLSENEDAKNAYDGLKQLVAAIKSRGHTLSKADIKTVYTLLKDRKLHPKGMFDKMGRFYLEDSELVDVRAPSTKYPYTQMNAARTSKFIVAMADKYNVNYLEELIDLFNKDKSYNFSIPEDGRKPEPVIEDNATQDENTLASAQDESAAPTEQAATPSNSITTGKTSQAKTPKGTKISSKFALVEAEKLVASHSASGAENPDYPQELQPRDRSRDASIAWVQKTSKELDPESLGRSSRVDTGAPIVGDDLIVESGNGRTIAIKMAYANGDAGEYRNWLADNADMFGFSAEQVEKYKHPILVRIRITNIDRAAFTVEANQDDKLSFTASERAKSDAKRLTGGMLELFTPSENGDLLAASNQQFVKAFLASLGETEAAQYTDSNGQPTQALATRMKAAVFSKAYDDDRLLEMMADQTNPELQNMINALSLAAGKFVEAQASNRAQAQDVADGLVNGIEKSIDDEVKSAIVEASNVLLSAKRNNQDVAEYVKQQGLFGDIDDATAELAVFLAQNARSAKKMAEYFKAMAGFIDSDANKRQTLDMFGEPEPLKLADVISHANQVIADNDLFSQLENEPEAQTTPTPEPQGVEENAPQQNEPDMTIENRLDDIEKLVNSDDFEPNNELLEELIQIADEVASDEALMIKVNAISEAYQKRLAEISIKALQDMASTS